MAKTGSYNDLTNKPTIPSIAGLATETYVDNGLATKVDKEAGKGLSTNDYTTTEKNKLAGIESGAQVNTVTSVAGKTGAVTLDKTDVGLSNVSNLAPADMPVSTATQSALDGKVTSTTTSNRVYGTNGAGVNVTIGYNTTTSAWSLVQRDAAGVVRFATPTFSDQGATKGYVDNLSPIYGTGFPNGVVAATPGRIYIDTNITNGIAIWYKKTGTGNTGYVPLSLSSTPPATATSTGISGQTAYDSDYYYICVATNTWKRTPLSSW